MWSLTLILAAFTAVAGRTWAEGDQAQQPGPRCQQAILIQLKASPTPDPVKKYLAESAAPEKGLRIPPDKDGQNLYDRGRADAPGSDLCQHAVWGFVDVIKVKTAWNTALGGNLLPVQVVELARINGFYSKIDAQVEKTAAAALKVYEAAKAVGAIKDPAQPDVEVKFGGDNDAVKKKRPSFKIEAAAEGIAKASAEPLAQEILKQENVAKQVELVEARVKQLEGLIKSESKAAAEGQDAAEAQPGPLIAAFYKELESLRRLFMEAQVDAQGGALKQGLTPSLTALPENYLKTKKPREDAVAALAPEGLLKPLDYFHANDVAMHAANVEAVLAVVDSQLQNGGLTAVKALLESYRRPLTRGLALQKGLQQRFNGLDSAGVLRNTGLDGTLPADVDTQQLSAGVDGVRREFAAGTVKVTDLSGDGKAEFHAGDKTTAVALPTQDPQSREWNAAVQQVAETLEKDPLKAKVQAVIAVVTGTRDTDFQTNATGTELWTGERQQPGQRGDVPDLTLRPGQLGPERAATHGIKKALGCEGEKQGKWARMESALSGYAGANEARLKRLDGDMQGELDQVDRECREKLALVRSPQTTLGDLVTRFPDDVPADTNPQDLPAVKSQLVGKIEAACQTQRDGIVTTYKTRAQQAGVVSSRRVKDVQGLQRQANRQILAREYRKQIVESLKTLQKDYKDKDSAAAKDLYPRTILGGPMGGRARELAANPGVQRRVDEFFTENWTSDPKLTENMNTCLGKLGFTQDGEMRGLKDPDPANVGKHCVVEDLAKHIDKRQPAGSVQRGQAGGQNRRGATGPVRLDDVLDQ